MGNATVGDEAPGGSVDHPDQDRVDDIGRRSASRRSTAASCARPSELLDERDRKRAQQDEPDPTTRDWSAGAASCILAAARRRRSSCEARGLLGFIVVLATATSGISADKARPKKPRLDLRASPRWPSLP